MPRRESGSGLCTHRFSCGKESDSRARLPLLRHGNHLRIIPWVFQCCRHRPGRDAAMLTTNSVRETKAGRGLLMLSSQGHHSKSCRWLQQQGHVLRVLEARSKPRCGQARLPARLGRSLPASASSWWLPTLLGFWPQHLSLPPTSCGLCVQIALGISPPHIQEDFISLPAGYTCNDPTCKGACRPGDQPAPHPGGLHFTPCWLHLQRSYLQRGMPEALGRVDLEGCCPAHDRPLRLLSADPVQQ